MTRVLLAVVALVYAFPAAAFPLVAAAVESGGGTALWTFLGAVVGGYASDLTRGRARVEAHERAYHGRV